MAQTHKQLTSDNAQLGDSLAALYTVPASTKAYVKTITIHNTNTSTESVELHLVGNGQSAGAANKFFHVELETNETLEISPVHPYVLTTGATIQAKTNTASTVNVKIDGMEEDV